MATTSRTRPGRGGFTLIELCIATALLGVMTLALGMSLSGLRRLALTSDAEAGLQAAANEALGAIVTDLRSSGRVTVGGKTYPYVFDAGEPDPGFEAHAHAPAAKSALAEDYDFGPDREIVFLTPADADGDGRPDVDADGRLAWGATERSYVLVTGADGVNRLERRADGGSPRTIVEDVERVVFDDAESSGWQIPLDAVRVRIFFRGTDGQGRPVMHSVEAVVGLRNG